jgi:hypothetical protein
MGTNRQGSVRPGDIKTENYLFFQTTPFLCLLNVKQTKIRGYFIYHRCKFNNSMAIKPVECSLRGTIIPAGPAVSPSMD